MSKKENDLNVLLAEREVQIRGETIIVREFTLADSMAMYDEIDALALEIAPLFDKTETLHFRDLDPIIARSFPLMQKLLSRSTGKDADWFGSLTASEGQIILDIWWTVNSVFFMNAVARKRITQAEITALGETSSAS